MLFDGLARRVLPKARVDERRRDVGVPERALDEVQVHARLG